MDTVSWYAGASNEAVNALGPSARPAQKDVTFDQVGDPPSERNELRHPVRRRPEDRAWRTPRTRQVQNVQAPLCREHLQLTREERLGGVALQHNRLTRRVLEALCQRPQWCDADTGAGENDLVLSPRPAAKAAVRALEKHPSAWPQVAQPGAAFAKSLSADS
jgi:hypothetical protein